MKVKLNPLVWAGRIVLLWALSLVLCPASQAQPPEPPPIEFRSDGLAILERWKELYEATGELEITAPAKAIARYQQFLDGGAAVMPPVLVQASSLMAQLYWQELGDQTKAIAVYEGALKQLGGNSIGGRLQTELQSVRLQHKTEVKPVLLVKP